MVLFDIAWNNIRRRKGRVLLLVLGLTIGVTTVVALQTITRTLQADVGNKLDEFGANILIVPQSNSLSLSYGGMSVSSATFDLQELTGELAEYLSFGPKRGVMIAGIRKGSQADMDGLQAGDIFVDVGGYAIDTVTSLKDALMESRPPVEAKIFRKSRFLTLTLHSLKK